MAACLIQGNMYPCQRPTPAETTNTAVSWHLQCIWRLPESNGIHAPHLVPAIRRGILRSAACRRRRQAAGIRTGNMTFEPVAAGRWVSVQ